MPTQGRGSCRRYKNALESVRYNKHLHRSMEEPSHRYYITPTFCTIMATQQLTPADLKGILEYSISVARKAGALILQGSDAITSASSQSGVEEKKNSVDLVTEYDVKVEELVKIAFNSKYPEFGL